MRINPLNLSKKNKEINRSRSQLRNLPSHFQLSGLCCRLILALSVGMACLASGQVAVPVGSGSYASSIPPADQFVGGFYSMTAEQVVTQFANLHLAPGITNRPVPSNKWWTDILVGDRSYQPTNGGPRVIRQDPYGGQLWAYPVMLAPNSSGFNLYFPNSWDTPANPNIPEGGFNAGPALPITGGVTPSVGSNDILIADFDETNYPPDWVTTGTAFGTGPMVGGSWPGESPPAQGFVGDACINTYRGGNGPQGTLTSPTFTIQKHYIHVLVGGGNDTNNDAVWLVIGTNVVYAAAGRQNGTLYWNTWDVSAYLGQTAHIEVVDTTSGSWGFVLCSWIVASDDGSDPATRYTSTYTPLHSEVTDWSDWGVQFGLPDALGNRMDLTLARGVPFVWTTYTGVKPRINAGSVSLYDTNGNVISTSSGSFTNSAFAFDYQGRSFGVFAPDNTVFDVNSSYIEAELSGTNNYLVYGLLPARTNLAEFAQYAYARVTGTEMDWNYNRAAGQVDTTWKLFTTPLKGGETNTLQGWLPHHYRTTQNDLVFKPYTYLTPRGVMKVAAGTEFHINYAFHGIAPMLPAPRLTGLTNDYVASRMSNYVANFVAAGHPQSFNETYGQGKELGISAQYMTFAHELGLTNQEQQLETGLRNLLADWFTYTPGETTHFFAEYTNWPALIGFSPSYGTEAFNDNHFHYGYFMVASALLGTEDTNFLAQYGGMAKLVAKEYANWDRSDTRFPLFRTFDIWEGHSWAGGFSSAGGENQESSSEAMNSWVGLFLMGNMLGDDKMTAAGAMGYAMESAAVNEYWQDMYRTNLPPGYGKGMVGILQSGGDSYATYFSGDPAWIYAIQWVPENHWNNYLTRDPAFANWQLTNLWQERVIASRYGINGFTLTDANNASALGGYLGNYVLGFQLLFDPDGVAAIMDDAYATNGAVATDPVYSGITYYLDHSLRDLGEQDPDYYTSLPTSQVYYNSRTGRRTMVLYNPAPTNQEVTLYDQGAVVKTFSVAPGASTINPSGQTNLVPVTIQLGKDISWRTTMGNQYQLQGSDDGSLWTNLEMPIAGNGATNTFFDSANHRSYRVLELTRGTSANVISNPGFETGNTTNDAADWTFSSNKSGIAPTRSSNSYDGNFSLRVYCQTDTNDGGHTVAAEQKTVNNTLQSVPVVPGQAYNFSMWIRGIPASELPAGHTGAGLVKSLNLYWTDGAGASISTNLNPGGLTGASSPGAWTQLQIPNLVAPGNAVGFDVQIAVTTGAVPQTGGGLYCDDLALDYATSGQTNALPALVQSAVRISWPTGAGQNYQVQSASALGRTNPVWSDFGPGIIGNGVTNAASDLIVTNHQKFYRVLALP